MSDAPEPRLQFYFKDLDRILEWNRLGNPARELSARVLAESVEDLEARLPEFGASLRLVKGIDPAWPTAFLHDPDWVRTAGSQDFLVGIGLTWQRATILGDPASGPWVGLRIMSPDSEAMSLRTRLKTATAAIRKAKGYEASWVQWAAHRAVPVPKGEWWEDLSCFRTAIVDAVQEAWSDLHQAADTTVRTWRGESEARSAQDT